MNYITRGLLLVFGLVFLGAGAASADTLPTPLLFDLTGPVTATFELPAGQLSIPPSQVNLGFGFVIIPWNLTINGAPSSDFLAFYNGAFDGAFWAFSSGSSADVALSGAQLYAGPENTPTFSPGTFSLAGVDGGNYTLTITTVSPTPEPSGLLLLAAGLSAMLLTGSMLSRFGRVAPIATS